MLLSLSLDLIDSFNRQESPILLQALERVVNIESERYVEQLFEDIVMKVSERFDFDKESKQDTANAISDKFFPDLEHVYSNGEMEEFLTELLAECDQSIGQRLEGVLSTRMLVEVRNDFE